MAPKLPDLNLSDSDYEDEVDIEDDEAPVFGKNKPKGQDATRNREIGGNKDGYSWEATYTRTWDAVREDESGSLQNVVEDLLARSRRRRLLAPQGAIRRTIIRHLIIIIDLSTSMLDRDMRPTRFDLTLQYTRDFIIEWFDQNPLGQIGIVGMRGGMGENICEMTGNPQDVVKTISERAKLQPDGEPSLQNAIEMARSSMSHLPTHSSREILILFGSLTTCDPGNIHETLKSCIADKIRISIVALAAEMKICRDMCTKTGGLFGVVLNEGHYKDLIFDSIPPPAHHALSTGKGPNATSTSNPSSDLLIMGFPTRLPEPSPPSLCVCHSDLKRHGYLCPRCSSKLCDVPTDCDICGLTIAYEARPSVADDDEPACTACSLPFPSPRPTSEVMEGVSPVGRYRCPRCKHDFCSQCDEFVHEILHVCPGCK